MSRKHVPYFDFYPADFMNGVRGLSAQEVGVYTMMLCRIYEESGPVEYHIPRLAAYCGMTDAAFGKAFARLVELGKFTLVDSMVSNRRAVEEIAKRETKLNSSKNAGKISAEKRQQKQREASTPVQQPFNHTDTDTDKSSVEAKASPGADAPIDPVKVMFDQGRALLAAAGKTPDQAGKLLGRWRNAHGTEAVIAALGRAQREGAIDPVGFIDGCLRFHRKRDPDQVPEYGEERKLKNGKTVVWAGAIDQWVEVRQ